MSLQQPIELLVLNNIDANVASCSQPQLLCFNYDWYLHINKNGTNGNPIMKIQVSNDVLFGWMDYSCTANNIELTENNMGFKDTSFTPKYFRICIEPNGTTTGTQQQGIFTPSMKEDIYNYISNYISENY